MDLRATICLIACGTGMALGSPAESPPNVVFILADDMGIGDVQALGARALIPTPHLDRLAADGLVFTDAHTTSSVCTPTRYGILTGRYNWRALRKGVLYGYSPPLIPADRTTVADLARSAGYATACIGKWHLGLDWPRVEGSEKKDDIAWEAPIEGGPNALGFDYFHGISASLDMPPYVWIRNDRVTEVPTTVKAFHRKGAAAESFEAVDVLEVIGQEAGDWIRRTHAADASQPQFLYVPLTAPHTPIVPSEAFAGKSPLGKYGDFVMEVDAVVGRIVDALRETGRLAHTLLIFTADNGCSPAAGIKDLQEEGHFPSDRYRGHKADIYEGGHRVPFIVHWPATVKPGGRCHALVGTQDLLATVAELTGSALPPDTGEDSISFLPLLEEPFAQPPRSHLVHHSINGSFAIREGRWKLNLCPGSGGWSAPRPRDTDGLPAVQLYDLSRDPAETTNLQAEQPEVVRRLREQLADLIHRGRSTPGPDQTNDVEVPDFGRSPAPMTPAEEPEAAEPAYDHTGLFPLLQDIHVSSGEDADMVVESEVFGWALLESPPARNQWQWPFACAANGTRNAVLVLADDPAKPVFCGVLAGAGRMAVWQGGWSDWKSGAVTDSDIDQGVLHVRREDGKLVFQVGASVLRTDWPEDLKRVRWFGPGVRSTTTRFGLPGKRDL